MGVLLAGLASHPIAAITSAVVVLGGGAATAAVISSDQPQVTVAGVIDGDTIRVDRGGDSFKVRLLNIDTPESVDPDKPVECLAPEATAFLKRQLPAGTIVDLQYDQERQDRYGRDLAGVFVDGVLVNAEIARAGYGAAIVVGGNDEFYEQVLTAQQEAERAGVGLHSPEIDCTIPAQMQAMQNKVKAAQSRPAPGQDLAAIDARQQELDALSAEAVAITALVAGSRYEFPMRAFTPDAAARLKTSANNAKTASASLSSANHDARAAEVERQIREAEEAARRAAEEEARRKAAEEEARRQAAEAEARERAAAEAESQRRSQQSSPSGSRSSGGSTSAGEPWNTPGPDLDCSDIRRKVWISGPDYHRLDADGDGWGCESYG